MSEGGSGCKKKWAGAGKVQACAEGTWPGLAWRLGWQVWQVGLSECGSAGQSSELLSGAWHRTGAKRRGNSVADDWPMDGSSQV